MDSERLLGHRVEVFELRELLRRHPTVGIHPIDLVLDPAQHVGMLAQPVKRPREPRGRGLVARDQHGDELIADLLVGHGAAVFVRGFEQ